MNKISIILGISCLSALLFSSCEKSNGSEEWIPETYIVISDIHLGDQRSIDDGYGWNLGMKDTLVAFLDHVGINKLCDRLIVAGDMIDEWVAPPAYPAFADRDSNIITEQQFFAGVVNANRSVFDKFRELKNSGIELVYIPGNHDMQLTVDDFTQVLPGLFTQARSAGADGMGEYQADKEVFIEHGHRYDIMNAPYVGKNGVDGIAGSILPPGFFVAKLACGARMQTGENVNPFKNIDDVSYNAGWETIGATFGQKDVATRTDGMTGTYSFDEYAYNTCKLFSGIDDTTEINDGWSVRTLRLNARFEPTVTESFLSGFKSIYCDKMALHVLEKTDFESRILVWGHSHTPELYLSTDSGEERVYVNTGCWVDGRICGKGNNATFCRITKTPDKLYEISLCRFYIDAAGLGQIEVISKFTIEYGLDGCRMRF